MSRYPYTRHYIESDDVLAVERALQSDHLTYGPEVEGFEKELADYCGAKYAVACANGTAALHLACLAAELSPGKKAVVSPITFLATANAPLMAGMDVLFADVDPQTIQLDAAQLERLLNQIRDRSIQAVVPTHFAGHPADIKKIHSVARQHGLTVIEDACHALGAAYPSDSGELLKVGSCRHSDMACFSFHAAKNITGGEGGAVTTNSAELYQKLKLFRSHGMTRTPDEFKDRRMGFDTDGRPNPWYYEMHALGFNYRITDIQCALLRSQLIKYPGWLSRRKEIAENYTRLLSRYFGDYVRPLPTETGVTHGHHLFVIRIRFDKFKVSRAQLMIRLSEMGIGTQVHYIPLTSQVYYRARYDIDDRQFPNANAYYEESLSLPFYSSLPLDAPEKVVKCLRQILN